MKGINRPDVYMDDKALLGVVDDDTTAIKGLNREDVYLSKAAHRVILVNPDGTPFVGGGGSGDGGPVYWANIQDKPTEFTPSAHTHEISDINGLQDELDTVFTQVSSGKLSLETAIETKGVKVNKSSDIATFDELRMAILAIVTGNGESTGNSLHMVIDDVVSIDFQQPTITNPTEYINYPITNVADSVTVTLQEV